MAARLSRLRDWLRGRYRLEIHLVPVAKTDIDQMASDIRVANYVRIRQRFPCLACDGKGYERAGPGDIVRCSVCRGTALNIQKIAHLWREGE